MQFRFLRGLFAASLFAVLVGCGGGSSTPSIAAAPPTAAATPATAKPSTAAGTPILVKDFALDPANLDVSGTSVSLAVTNAGPTIHNVTIRDGAGAVIAASPDLREGESATVTTEIPAGTYVMFCSLPGHESLGIKGTFVVAP